MRKLPVLWCGLAVGCVPHLYTSQPKVSGVDWVAPSNRWALEAPPETLRGEGFEVGEIPPDFRLADQYGDEVSLWQFYGRLVLLDVSTMWCAPCQEIAVHAQETHDAYADDGFVYLTVLQEDVDGFPPTREDLEDWVDTFGIASAPVVADGDYAAGDAVLNGQYPAVLLLDREMVVHQRVNPVSDQQIREAIERLR